MLPERVIVEVGGRDFRLSFDLTALAKFQRIYKTPNVGETMVALGRCGDDVDMLLQALWTGTTPLDDGEHYPSAEAMGRDIPVRGYNTVVEAVYRAIAEQITKQPNGEEREGEHPPLPTSKKKPRKT